MIRLLVTSRKMTKERRDALIKSEQEQQSKFNYTAEPSMSQKYFSVFPFPYVNGTLHLGHGYTLSKADFTARFKRLRGYNVLFPFGFHGTGMPIVSCAKKLDVELKEHKDSKTWDKLPNDSQIKILLNMKIPQDEIYKFVDPYYWLKYFPTRHVDDLKAFGASIDFTRSFVTTDMNPYFDSFVKWQFNHLNKKKLLKYGKRYIIYSVKDQQPCADHDRSSGEGVVPVEYVVYPHEFKDERYGEINLLVCRLSGTRHMESDTTDIYINSKLAYKIFKYKGKMYVSRDFAVLNLQHQLENITDVAEYKFAGDFPSLKFTCGSGIYKAPKDQSTMAKTKLELEKVNPAEEILRAWHYYEPESTVISRSGDTCIVALTDQWFINYGDHTLKTQVDNYLATRFQSTDPQVLHQLQATSEWLNEWPVSRHYGLGTKLLDTDYVIDSLSDSTIYMAYYCVAHLVTQVPMEHINDSFWDTLFLNQPNKTESKYHDVMMQMKKEFGYWYPVDMRVSGKDLIGNHLTMCMYNHVAVWGSDKYCPVSYLVNGHLLLNGQKISKHTGNFITLRDAIDKYSADVVRLSLAEGEGLEDADFREQNADGLLMKLYNERTKYYALIDQLVDHQGEVSDGKYTTFWDRVFDIEIVDGLNNSYNAFEECKFRKAIYNGFYKMLAARDNYQKLCDAKYISASYALLYKFLEQSLLSIEPVIPHFVANIWEYAEKRGVKLAKTIKLLNDTYDNKLKSELRYHANIIDYTVSKCNSLISAKLKKGKYNNDVKVTIYENFTSTEEKVLQYVKEKFYPNCLTKEKWSALVSEYISANGINKSEAGQYSRFMAYVKNNIEKFGIYWIDFVLMDQTNACALYKEFIPIMTVKPIQLCFEKASIKTLFKGGPGSPDVN